jgi:hypothetical protein
MLGRLHGEGGHRRFKHSFLRLDTEKHIFDKITGTLSLYASGPVTDEETECDLEKLTLLLTYDDGFI